MQTFNVLVPHKFEVLLYAMIAFLIAVVGNLEFFSQQLALVDSATDASVIQLSSDYIQLGINYLDSFAVSAVSAVFVFWSFVGILTLSIIHSVYGVYSEVSQDVNVATKFYHPSNYSNSKFWIGVVLNVFLNFGLYVVVIFAGFFISVVLSPLVIASIQDIVSGISGLGIVVAVLGFMALWGGLTIFGVGMRLILLRNQIEV